MNLKIPLFSDTPLTKAVLLKEPKRLIMLLCRYGAFLEFRDRNGYTALHHASVNGKHESMQVRYRGKWGYSDTGTLGYVQSYTGLQ